MFQWDNALIWLGLTVLAVNGIEPNFPVLYLYVFVAVFGSGLAVGIRWWSGHLTTVISRILAFIVGIFGAGICSPWLMNKFAMDGLDALMVIGLSSLISARIIVFITAQLDIETLGKAGQNRIVKTIDPTKKNQDK